MSPRNNDDLAGVHWFAQKGARVPFNPELVDLIARVQLPNQRIIVVGKNPTRLARLQKLSEMVVIERLTATKEIDVLRLHIGWISIHEPTVVVEEIREMTMLDRDALHPEPRQGLNLRPRPIHEELAFHRRIPK